MFVDVAHTRDRASIFCRTWVFDLLWSRSRLGNQHMNERKCDVRVESDRQPHERHHAHEQQHDEQRPPAIPGAGSPRPICSSRRCYRNWGGRRYVDLFASRRKPAAVVTIRSSPFNPL